MFERGGKTLSQIIVLFYVKKIIFVNAFPE